MEKEECKHEWKDKKGETTYCVKCGCLAFYNHNENNTI